MFPYHHYPLVVRAYEANFNTNSNYVHGHKTPQLSEDLTNYEIFKPSRPEHQYTHTHFTFLFGKVIFLALVSFRSSNRVQYVWMQQGQPRRQPILSLSLSVAQIDKGREL